MVEEGRRNDGVVGEGWERVGELGVGEGGGNG